MRTLIVCFLLFCNISVCCAQNTDSLKKELAHAPNDRQRTMLLYRLVDAYSYGGASTADSCKAYADKIVATHDDSLIMESYLLLSYVYGDMGDMPKALSYSDKAIELGRKLNNNRRLAKFLVDQCSALANIPDIPKFIERTNEGLAVAIKAGDKNAEAAVYYTRGLFYEQLQRNDVALDYQNKSLRINDSLKNYRMLANNYSGISQLFGRQKRYREALKYGVLADSILGKISPTGLERDFARMNLAIIYKNLGEFDRAIDLYNECLKSSDPRLKMTCYDNLALALAGKKDYQQAIACLRNAQQINDTQVHMVHLDFAINNDLGAVLFKMGHLDSAIYYTKKAEAIGSTIDKAADEYADCVHQLADIYEANGDLKSALLYTRKYQAAQDSAHAKVHNQILAEQEALLKVNEKDKALAMLAQQNELNNVKAQRQVIALVFIGITVVVVIIAYRRAVTKNATLYRQKQELSEQKAIINEQVEQLTAAATMKSRFLANISHELRTPVTLITGMLETVHNKATKRELVDPTKTSIAYNNSRKLQFMVEEITDLTKAEIKNIETKLEVKELQPLLRRVVFAFETLISKEGLTLEYHDEHIDNIAVCVDENKFEKVLNNLLYNAVKFNKPRGAIKVSATPTAKNMVRIVVEDTGMGIAAGDVPHIFERYYQGETNNSARAAGMGVGLSLVKEFTEQQNGGITVSSVQGTGTTFTLLFPVSDKQQHAEEETPIPEADWKKLPGRSTILIVEDNAEMRYYLKDILGNNVNIAEAGNGREALAWLENHYPDLIITDMMMPEMDGREFTQLLKADRSHNKIPIIMLTALADTDTRVAMLRIGLDDYIVKPFNADELRVRVFNLLTNAEARKEYSQQPDEPNGAAITEDEATQFMEKVKEAVLSNLKNVNFSVADIAQKMTMSERQLFRMSKSLTGYSPAQLIKEIRLQKAYEFLLSGDVTKVEDVANRVGFDNAGYFSRQFAERFGKRPTEFL